MAYPQMNGIFRLIGRKGYNDLCFYHVCILALALLGSANFCEAQADSKTAEKPVGMVNGILKLPNGQPASGVSVTVLPGNAVVLKDGRFQSRGQLALQQAAEANHLSIQEARRRFIVSKDNVEITDAEGHFALPAGNATLLVAAGSQGYAEAHLDRSNTPLILALQPWGRIEGVVRNGTKPASNQWIRVTADPSGLTVEYDRDVGSYRVQSDEQGRIVITNVPPGERFLARLYSIRNDPDGIENNQGWLVSHVEKLLVKSGEATHVVYGGHGRSITGKVVVNPKPEMGWKMGGSLIAVPAKAPAAATNLPSQLEASQNFPEIKAAHARSPRFAVIIADDGCFRADDVPPGEYTFDLPLYERHGDTYVRTSSLRKVIEITGTTNDGPIDLGTIDLKIDPKTSRTAPANLF